MAKLKVIGSGSSGNGYIIECKHETLIVELGCKWKDYLKALDWDVSNVRGLLTSHIHQDHSNDNTVKKALVHGMRVYSCQEVVDKFNHVILVPLGQKTHIGGFTIEPIAVKHNAECYSYIIEHEEFGKLMFMTDLVDFPYNIRKVNHWLIEANYSNEVILNRLIGGESNCSMNENHLPIEKTCAILKRNFSLYTQTIVLLHLSDTNSDENAFKKAVQDTLGFDNVYIASKGLEVELNEEEF